VPGSWLFSYSDTLIRLFPMQFWFDAMLAISLFSFAGRLLLMLLSRRWQKVIANSRAKQETKSVSSHYD
jgi:uncharacterized membrane protein